MSADVSTVLTRIALLERTVTNPVSGSAVVAFENPPYTISAYDMPLFVNFPGPLTRNELIGSDEQAREFLETRSYSLILYHSPYMAGIEGEMYGLLTPFFEQVYTIFGSFPLLQRLSEVQNAVLIGDSGAALQNYLQQQYYGIRFNLQVTGRVRRALALGD